jgi:hypothetical protein
MTPVRAAALCAAALFCADSSGQTPASTETSVLPDEAVEAIEQSGCPRAANVSAEECLIWLNSREAGDAASAARDLGAGKTPPDSAAEAVAAGELLGDPELESKRVPAKAPR